MAKKTKQPISDADLRKLHACYRLLGSCNQFERDNAFGRIAAILQRYGRKWSDLLALLAPTATISGISEEDRKALREQHEVLGGTPEEREKARAAILWILERYRCKWNDLLGIIASATATAANPTPLILLPVPTAPDPLELLTGFIPQFVDVTEDEIVASSLWIIHTYLYDQFEITPRLSLVSPVPGCGKTTKLKIIKTLGATPLKTDGISPAAIYHLIDRERRTLLKLPLTVIRRSIILRMKMTTRELKRIEFYHDDFDIVRSHIIDWAQGRQLNRDPEMPKQLKNRIADNWRVLLAIADAVGAKWGEIARGASVRLSARYFDEDLKLILLADIRTVFDTRRIDRILRAELLDALLKMEGQPWAEYCDVQGDETPRRLTVGTLSGLLKPFGIKARTVWPLGRTADTRSGEGFYRAQFEETWRSYLPEDDTSTQSNVIKALASG